MHPLLNDAGTGLHPNCKVWRAPKGHKRKGRSQKPPQPEPPPISFVVAQMAERQMLPAIYFIFSRRGCDKAVRDLGVQCLVTQEEQARIKERLTAYSNDNPEAFGMEFTLMRCCGASLPTTPVFCPPGRS